ncbi:MAG: hypothetical protein CVV14_11045 [Gammaproteobacteria bacterium HGW-Gammaproteobacteria-4]|nr:MAG: hypothetical protein CVV14_11045 [Gammaproteobacteria bacterium HGW-Gammaproteobacteria-4]
MIGLVTTIRPQAGTAVARQDSGLGKARATPQKQERMSAKDAKSAKKTQQDMGFPLRTLRALRTICVPRVPSPESRGPDILSTIKATQARAVKLAM